MASKKPKNHQKRLSQTVKNILLESYYKDAYPCKEKKKELVEKTAMTREAVDQFFTNARRRIPHPYRRDINQKQVKLKMKRRGYKEIELEAAETLLVLSCLRVIEEGKSEHEGNPGRDQRDKPKKLFGCAGCVHLQ